MTMSSSPCCREFEYGGFGGGRGGDNDGEFEFGGVCCFYCRCPFVEGYMGTAMNKRYGTMRVLYEGSRNAAD